MATTAQTQTPASPPRTRTIDDEDESVRIAVRALGDMRNRALASHSTSSLGTTPALSIASSSTSPTIASPILTPEDIAAAAAIGVDVDSPDFVSRVSHLPIVNSALRAYEQSKASSRVVKYGAEMMESSMKTISRPVIDRLPVNQLDEFARRQLDRFGYGPNGRRPSFGGAAQGEELEGMSSGVDRGRSGWESGLQMRDVSMTRRSVEREESAVREDAGPLDRQTASLADENVDQQRQLAQRSRWQTVLLEAGGIGAAVSEESMRRLKYCLQWLQYATQHIDGQILLLRDFMTSLQPPPGSPNALNPDAIISPEHMQQLNNVKRDVVNTIRQVVDVVSKYTGGALPEPARSRVRGFILHLPQAWVSASRRQAGPPTSGSGSSAAARGRGARRSARRNNNEPLSRPASPSTATSPRHSRHSSASTAAGAGVPVTPTASSARQAAQRILTLATESLDMMRGVTAVVKDSLDRADTWVDRLRVVGLQRQGSGMRDNAGTEDGERGLPPPLDLDLLAHRTPTAMASTNTSVANSPAMSSATLSPLLHPPPPPEYFGEAGVNGFGKLSLGGGKKGLFAEEGETG
ncbi:transcription factor Opi1-domain-containing protein, partial [Amylostereum chailletii]